MDYLNALAQMTTILSKHPIALRFIIPHKLEIVAFMMVRKWREGKREERSPGNHW